VRTLTLAGVEFLCSERGAAALGELGESTPGRAGPADVEALRKRGFSPDESGWLLDQVRLRAKARGKLPAPERLLLTAEALEQASGVEVATWRARRFATADHVLDLGAGIGGDALALAAAGRRVTAVERDPVRAALLEHNASALGLTERITVRRVDWTAEAWSADAAFADPARRVDGKRVLGLEAMLPPLSALVRLTEVVPDLLAKVAPGLDPAEVPAGVGLEFVSVGGELKEALLAWGRLRRADSPVATVLPTSDGPPHDLTGDGPAEAAPATVAPPGEVLLEPDPAVLRAGLVRTLAARLGGWQLDPTIAFLSADDPPPTPFARRYRVLRHGPFSRKALGRWLRDLKAGPAVVRTRGVPVDGPSLAKRLPATKGAPPVDVFVSRTPNGPLALVTRRER
jgi:hypothetical protein